MILGIDHIEIVVNDVKAHVEFYEKLGFKLLRWTDHHGGSAELQIPGENQPIIELHQVLTEENPGINHIAFKVDDVDATYRDLSAKGVKFHLDVHDSVTGRKKADARCPDGWRIQFSHVDRAPVKEIESK